MSVEVRVYQGREEPEVIKFWSLAFPNEPTWNESKS